MKTGLHVNVFRCGLFKGCSAGGPSERFEQFTLVDPSVSGPFEPSKDSPEINIRRINCGGEYIFAVPASLADKQVMAGGSFIYSSDSRFRDVCPYPIPIHDRVEDFSHQPND